jgi:hypothetical protein
VAQAPKASSHHLTPKLTDLELDQAWLPAAAAADAAAAAGAAAGSAGQQGASDINLSLLTACLLPSAQVRVRARAAVACRLRR